MALDRISNRQAERTANLLARLIVAIWRMWSPLSPSDWWDKGLTSGIAGRSAVLVDRAVLQVRKDSRAYAALVLRQLGIESGILPDPDAVYPRSGVDPQTVYERPADLYRWRVAQGDTHEEALEKARRRLETIAETDLRRAGSDEEHDVYDEAPTVVGFRRVIHPELSASGVCGLCIVAATRFYTLDELMPLHDRCKCSTAPITSDSDPGLALNQEDLERIYEQAGSTGAGDLARIRVREVTHGELGPMLTEQGDAWRGPRESGSAAYKRPTVTDEVTKWEAIAETSQRMVDAIEGLRAAGLTSGEIDYPRRDGSFQRMKITDSQQALDYHRQTIARCREKLAALAA